jgi:hypothetical protein
MIPRTLFPVVLLRALVVTALVLALPAFAAAQFEPAPNPAPAPDPDPVPVPEEEPVNHPSFVPRPDAVFLERTVEQPDLGNTRVILVVNDQEVERLKAETDDTSVILVGPDGKQVAFRDDGLEGDAAAGDLEFTAVAELDFDDLAERAAEEGTSQERGENSVPVFEGRAQVDETVVEPFDFDGFQSGARVELARSLSISSFGTSSQEEEHEGEHGEEGGLHAIFAGSHVPGTNQFQDRVLMIRNPVVVADPTRTFDPCTGGGNPTGPWTFAHLMTQMANQRATGINPSAFVETWLREWLVNPQTINGFNVPPRAAMQALINDWQIASGGIGAPLNLSRAPFRLLSINPRVDLRTTVGGGGGYGSTGSGAFLDAGEARFTFGIVLPQNFTQSQNQFIITAPLGNNCLATSFSVIFEFRVPKCDCKDVRDWARQWRRLNTMVPGSVQYNRHLERLTRTFTDANRNPARPNRSAIGQVRSNEISLQFPWEIREFQLGMMPWNLLLETTTADTPDDSFNNTVTFGNFVIDVRNGVAGPSVPLIYPLGSAQNFLGAHPQTPNPNTTFWNAPNLLPAHQQTRFQVSLGTCNACHARETGTFFQHVVSTAPLPAPLSGFLTGIHVADPVTGQVRSFDDLARRETDINAVARMACGKFRPIRFSPFIFGPLRSDGTEVRSIAAAAETDPDATPLSLAPEDFLREVVQQVH